MQRAVGRVAETASIRSSRCLAACASIALAILAACSSTAVDEGPVPVDQWCSTSAAEQCGRLGACCQSAGNTFDDTTCRATVAATCDAQVAQRQARGVAYDAAAARSCVVKARSSMNGCVPRGRDDPAVRAAATACGAVWVGRKQDGDECLTAEECMPVQGQKAACAKALVDGKPAATSTCAYVPVVPVEATCGSDAICEQGLYCDASTKPAVCTATRAIGEACTLGSTCDSGNCNAGTCTAPTASIATATTCKTFGTTGSSSSSSSSSGGSSSGSSSGGSSSGSTGGGCSLSCPGGVVSYSCGSSSSVITYTYCSNGRRSGAVIRTGGHTITCIMSCSGSGGSCSDDTGKRCSF